MQIDLTTLFIAVAGGLVIGFSSGYFVAILFEYGKKAFWRDKKE